MLGEDPPPAWILVLGLLLYEIVLIWGVVRWSQQPLLFSLLRPVALPIALLAYLADAQPVLLGAVVVFGLGAIADGLYRGGNDRPPSRKRRWRRRGRRHRRQSTHIGPSDRSVGHAVTCRPGSAGR